jgi:hypothetical protein
MAEVVSMPKLGFDMAEGTLVRWVAAEEVRSLKATCWLKSRRTRLLWKWRAPQGVVLSHWLKRGHRSRSIHRLWVIGAVEKQSI